MFLICVSKTKLKMPLILIHCQPVGRTTAPYTHQTLVYKQSKCSQFWLAEMDFAEVPSGQEAPWWLWVLLRHLQNHQRAHSPVKHLTNIHQTTWTWEIKFCSTSVGTSPQLLSEIHFSIKHQQCQTLQSGCSILRMWGVFWITPDLLWVKWFPHSIICNWKWEVRVNEFSSPTQIFISCPLPQ